VGTLKGRLDEMLILYSDKCLEYGWHGHPESPERVYAIYKFLKKKNFRFIEPEPCDEDDLLLVHSREYVEMIKEGRLNDPDTPNIPGIYDYAKLSAGSAVKAMEISLDGENSFSITRPPGHHTGKNGRALGAVSLGFCYFNNVAIACAKALEDYKVRRVAIVDIDCHHGNGTQDIFLGDSRVLFVSLHRFGFFYPGTGGSSELNCLNYPLRYDITEADYIRVLESALEEVRKFNPDLVAVSAGFDTYRFDPVGGLGLSKEAYIKIGELISKLNKRTFIVLEGGYSRDIGECAYNLIVGFEDGFKEEHSI